jgi:hypothetical protein
MMFFDDCETAISKDVIKSVTKIAEEFSVTHLVIDSYDDIKTHKVYLQGVSEAVLFMNGELGRGISIKMANDAVVFIVD